MTKKPLVIVRRVRGRRAVKNRFEFLQANPLCKHCQQKGLITLAVVVDHVIPLFQGGSDHASNKQSLCKDCHRVKSVLELGNKINLGSDKNGFPLDPNHPWNKEVANYAM